MDGTNPIPAFPSNDSLTPFWRIELRVLDQHRCTEHLPQTFDVIIIGAGYAGIAIACHLLCNEDTAVTPKPSIVLLEARQACSGATGRNVKKQNIDCDFKLMRSFDIYTEPNVAAAAKADYLKLKKAGIAKTTTDDIVFADGEKAEKFGIPPMKSEPTNPSQMSGVKGCISWIETSAGQLWPYKLMMGLLCRAVADRLNLLTNTPCASLHASANSRGKRVANTS